MSSLIEAFEAGLADGLTKEARYPTSRLLTSRKATGVLPAHLLRSLTSRASIGRLRRGGAGLKPEERKLLTEISGGKPGDLEGIIGKLTEKAGKEKLPTYPVSRFLTHRFNPLGALARMMGIRGLADRLSGAGRLPFPKKHAEKRLTGREQHLVGLLKGARPKDTFLGEAKRAFGDRDRMKKALPALVAGVAPAALLAAPEGAK